jgi:hypothetical protein
MLMDAGRCVGTGAGADRDFPLLEISLHQSRPDPRRSDPRDSRHLRTFGGSLRRAVSLRSTNPAPMRPSVGTCSAMPGARSVSRAPRDRGPHRRRSLERLGQAVPGNGRRPVPARRRGPSRALLDLVETPDVACPKSRCRGVSRPRWRLSRSPNAHPGSPRAWCRVVSGRRACGRRRRGNERLRLSCERE